MNRIYLDNAATTPLDPQVMEAMLPYLSTHFGNPSSIYSYGRETRLAVENARKTVARLVKASPGEIFFTSGGTESDNMALVAAVAKLHGTAPALSDAAPGLRVTVDLSGAKVES